jgi:hypothetical protein
MPGNSGSLPLQLADQILTKLVLDASLCGPVTEVFVRASSPKVADLLEEGCI